MSLKKYAIFGNHTATPCLGYNGLLLFFDTKEELKEHVQHLFEFLEGEHRDEDDQDISSKLKEIGSFKDLDSPDLKSLIDGMFHDGCSIDFFGRVEELLTSEDNFAQTLRAEFRDQFIDPGPMFMLPITLDEKKDFYEFLETCRQEYDKG